ncbi:MAG: FHA domain-containing protein [Clostridium sp.]|nr:FHA domain-containing protein [Clostridium sp.]
MEVRYRREMNHNYMIIDASAQESGYECRMLAGNHIEGLLRFRVRYGEEKREFYYEITSRQPLRRVLEKRKATGEEIRRILLAVVTVVRRIEEYLLPEEQLLLDPDFLYVDPDSFDVRLCLLPGHICDWPKELSALLQYLLEQADPQDKEALVLAYHLYQESLKENYGAADLMKYLAPSEKPVPEKGLSAGEQVSGEEIIFGKGRVSGEEKRIEKETFLGEEKLLSVEETFGEKAEKKENTRLTPPRRRIGWTVFRSCVFGFLGAEAILWYLRGTEGLQSYGIFPVIGFFVLLAGNIFLETGKKGSKNGRRDHRIVSEENGRTKSEEDHRTGSAGPKNSGAGAPSWELRAESEDDYRDRVRKREEEEMKKSREDGTVLLTELGEAKGIGRLEPLDREAECIEIPYIPFIIGKHPQLTDYCLLRPTVSRLHLRIDQKENVCIVTDLNSTNGTSVNGYALQANETVSIKTGDTIYLADVGFRFYERG